MLAYVAILRAVQAVFGYEAWRLYRTEGAIRPFVVERAWHLFKYLDGEFPRERGGLYILAAMRLIKIGIASDFAQRRRNLQNQSFVQLRSIYQLRLPIELAREVETALKHVLYNDWVRGEIFRRYGMETQHVLCSYGIEKNPCEPTVWRRSSRLTQIPLFGPSYSRRSGAWRYDHHAPRSD